MEPIKDIGIWRFWMEPIKDIGIQRFWMEPIKDIGIQSEVLDRTYQRYWNSEVPDGTYQRYWNSEMEPIDDIGIRRFWIEPINDLEFGSSGWKSWNLSMILKFRDILTSESLILFNECHLSWMPKICFGLLISKTPKLGSITNVVLVRYLGFILGLWNGIDIGWDLWAEWSIASWVLSEWNFKGVLQSSLISFVFFNETLLTNIFSFCGFVTSWNLKIHSFLDETWIELRRISKGCEHFWLFGQLYNRISKVFGLLDEISKVLAPFERTSKVLAPFERTSKSRLSFERTLKNFEGPGLPFGRTLKAPAPI
ncbi:hypothetical protein RhiirB3_453939 [Rhizophagus irregularis]|nr:hypothetical protein RhiirB3_453939 [Rhizophagus irregularis]